MKHILSTPDIAWKTLGRLRQRRGQLLRLASLLFALCVVANSMRALLPGMYVFNPFDQAWLLIPEAMIFGPILALISHQLSSSDAAFALSRETRLIKFFKASIYCYVLLIVFKVGLFAAQQVIPALIGYVFGPSVVVLYPVIVAIGCVFFLLVYSRLVLVYPALAANEQEPMVASLLLSKGKGRQIVGCLLLLAAPVLIPWMAAEMSGGNWIDPTRGPGIGLLPIFTRSLLQSLGAIVLSTGVCVMYETLVAAAEEAEGESDQDT